MQTQKSENSENATSCYGFCMRMRALRSTVVKSVVQSSSTTKFWMVCRSAKIKLKKACNLCQSPAVVTCFLSHHIGERRAILDFKNAILKLFC